MWDVQENRQYETFIKIDEVDLSENLIDMNISFDLDGSSVSSIFGSVLRYNIEFELFDNIEGKVIDIDFGYYVGDYMDEPTYDIKNFGQFKIIEFEYDEKMNTTKMKAETDLSNLDDDFSLQDLPNEQGENLIPDGWNSFEHNGSGKNYVDNWDFSSDDRSEITNYGNDITIENGILKVETNRDVAGASIRYSDINYIGNVIVRLKINAPFGSRVAGSTGTSGERISIKPNSNYEVHELLLSLNSVNNRIFIYTDENASGKKGHYIEIDWIQITPVDDQHLVVEKTPLGNGLTRIQTWGGTTDIKLKTEEIPNDIEENTPMLYSFYIENNGKDEVRFLNNWSISGEPYPEGAEYMIVVPPNYKGMASLTGTKAHGKLELNVRSSSVIDIVASEPQIVEGIPDRFTNSIIENSLKDGETVDLPSINLPVGDLSDKFYARRLDLFQDIAKLTKTYLEVHGKHYVFREIVEQDITLPVFELEHSDTLEPIDTVDITWHYGDNVADGEGNSIIQLDQVELIRDIKEEMAPILLGIYKGFTHQEMKFKAPSTPFVFGKIKLDSKLEVVSALITKGKFNVKTWIGEYESNIIDQEENHTNYVGDYDRGWRETQIMVDKVNGEIILLNEVVEETGDKVSEMRLDVDSITAKVNSLNTNDNIIVNLAGTLDNYEYWTFEGTESLRYYEGLRYKENLRYNNAFEVIPTDDTLSRYRLSFHSKNKAVTAEGFIIPDTIYSFRAIRYKGSHAITCAVREYDKEHKLIREVPYKLQSTKVLSFSHKPSENTKFIRLAFHIPTSTYSNRQEISDLMFNRGEPKEFRTSSGDVKLWAESEIKQLDDSVTVAIDKVDETDYKINNTTVKITPEEGVEIWSTRGKGLTIRDNNGNETITLNTDGSLNMIGNLTAGTVGGLIIRDQVISFPGGKIEFDTENNAIVFGSLSMSYDEYDNMDSIHFSSNPADKYDGLRIVTRRGHSAIHNVREIHGYMTSGKDDLDIIATNLKLNSHTTTLTGSNVVIGSGAVPAQFNVNGSTVNIHANLKAGLYANWVEIGYTAGANTGTVIGSRVLYLQNQLQFDGSGQSIIQMKNANNQPLQIKIDKNDVLWIGGRQVAYR